MISEWANKPVLGQDKQRRLLGLAVRLSRDLGG